MAIAPNVTFVSGAVYTASQANAYGFAACSYTTSTTNSTGITTVSVQITGTAFTAITNRNYKITYYEPAISCTTTADAKLSILNGATQLQGNVINVNASFSNTGVCQIVSTFSAGSVTLTGNLTAPSGGSLTAARGATTPAFLLVEDIGPA